MPFLVVIPFEALTESSKRFWFQLITSLKCLSTEKKTFPEVISKVRELSVRFLVTLFPQTV